MNRSTLEYPRRSAVAVAVALTCLGAGAARAAGPDIGFEATAGAGQSDNIRRAPSDEQSETIGTVGVKFSLDERSARVDADVVANLAYFDYLENTYDGELLGNLAANSTFEIVDDRFVWSLSDNFGQVLTDPFAAPTPDTRENLNFLATGPGLELPIGSQTQLDASLRYLLADFETSPFDWNGVSGQIGVQRLLSANSSWGVNVRDEKYEYDEAALNADYEQREAFARFQARGGLTNLAIDLGYTSIDRDAAADKEDGLLLRAEVSRRVGARSQLQLGVSQQFANTATSFSSQQGGAGGLGLEAVPGRQTGQPFRDRDVRLGWSTTGLRTRLALSGDWRDQSYSAQSSLDQTLTTLSANVSRDLSPTITLGLGVSSGRGSFDQPGGDYEELRGTMDLEWRLSRRLVTQLSVDYIDRSSDALNGDYSESRIWLTFGYRHGVPRTERRQPEFQADRRPAGE